jgi:hypothetical protein
MKGTDWFATDYRDKDLVNNVEEIEVITIITVMYMEIGNCSMELH